VGLFHSGAGAKSSPNKRTNVFSVYSDGLQHGTDLYPPLSIPAKSSTPLFYRNDHHPTTSIPPLDSDIADNNDNYHRKTIKTTYIQTALAKHKSLLALTLAKHTYCRVVCMTGEGRLPSGECRTATLEGVVKQRQRTFLKTQNCARSKNAQDFPLH